MEKAKHRNGIRHDSIVKEKARQLRRDGFTHREIEGILRISRGSAYEWTKDIILSADQKHEIQVRKAEKVYTPELRARLSAMAKIHLVQYRKEYTKEELLTKITDFYHQNHRIPLKREFNMYREYQHHFGGWNKAIRIAGFDTNPQLFAYKFTAADGHRCDSFSERIIDDWLFERRIPHERHWHYGNTKMTADFFIEPDIIIEFFGLAGVQDQYDAIIERKRMFCAEHYIQLIEIYPENVFPQSNLSGVGAKLDILLKKG